MRTTQVLSIVMAFSFFAGFATAGETPEIDPLPYRVTDAEFSQKLDRIVAISSTPTNSLYIYNPTSGSSQKVDLPLVGNCVSVGPDGLYAAVGHDGFITYVDLLVGVIVDTFAVGADPSDIVLAGNGFIYAFPRTGQWVRIHCIEIETGIETEHTGGSVRHGTQAKLHPNGTSIYGADNGLSPSDIEKYDITPGTAQFLYDSPYHGDYSMCGDLWMSDEGFRIFTRCGNVFRSSDVREEDMIYNGSLSELNAIEWLDHSSSNDKIYVIPSVPFGSGDDDTFLQIYDYEFLTHEETLSLPRFQTKQGSHLGHGRFVFFDADGRKAYIVLQADEDSGLLFDYGVATMQVPGQITAEILTSPPTGTYVSTQRFDIAVVVNFDGATVTGATATFDGEDVSGFFNRCMLRGRALDGGRTFRCPDFAGRELTPGIHILEIRLDFSDGSSKTDRVAWNVMDVAEPGTP